MLRHWTIAAALVVTTAPAVATGTATTSAATSAMRTKHVTHTYLRAKPGKRAALIAYVEQNWFAMDRVGIERGLFTNYALLVRPEDVAADWDIVVTVGYPTPEGHDAPGVADAFGAIRDAHREIKIDGLRQRDLGSVVEHHALTLVAQGF